MRPPLRVLDGGGRGPSLAPALEFAAIGAGLALTMALLGELPSWHRNLGTLQSLFALAFAFYSLALLRLRRYERLPRVELAVLAAAVRGRPPAPPPPPPPPSGLLPAPPGGRP